MRQSTRLTELQNPVFLFSFLHARPPSRRHFSRKRGSAKCLCAQTRTVRSRSSRSSTLQTSVRTGLHCHLCIALLACHIVLADQQVSGCSLSLSLSLRLLLCLLQCRCTTTWRRIVRRSLRSTRWTSTRMRYGSARERCARHAAPRRAATRRAATRRAAPSHRGATC